MAGSFATALFGVVFAALALAALVIGLENPFGPGQDYHYHVMSAALTARVWSGDAFYDALYVPVNPLDSNTLLYTLLFPLEKLLTPVDAMRVGFSVLYFVGYPVSCVVALRVLRRPLWGALLAFPLMFVKGWSGGGYLPFVASAPLMIVTFALLHRVLDPVRSSAPSRRLLLGTAALASLLFLAHAHVFAWTLGTFALLTVLVLVRGLAVDGLRDPALALRAALRLALRMLAVVAVPVGLAAWWYLRKQSGALAAVGPTTSVVLNDSWTGRVGGALAFLVHARGDREFLYAGAVVVLCTTVLLFLPRATADRVPSFEIGFVLALVTFLVFPISVNAQGLSSRQFDLAIWLLPCIVYPRAAKGLPVRHVLVVAAFAALAVVRLSMVARHLRDTRAELGGLYALTKECPTVADAELAYVSMTMESESWLAPTFHHDAETLAASCHLDTPIYDARIYPYNLAPIRYRGAPPAPPKLLHDDQTWYLHGGLWDAYEYVLVHAWKPTPEQLARANDFGERIRLEGEWELWQRRATRPH